MKTCLSNRRARHVTASVLLIMGAGAAFSATPPAASPPAANPPTASPAAPSKETREKMASLHEQMAACLRSDKPIADCHSQMMKSCQDAMGEKGCRMMGHGMMGGGSGKHDHMTHDPAKNPDANK